MTLTQAALPSRSVLTNILLILAGTVIIALSAQVTVPMFPVPMTLQTLSVALVGMVYGSRLGAATLITYLAQGALGLPVFAGGGMGVATLIGPTGGFLFGFVGMAWLAGFMVERGFDRGFLRLFAAALVPSILLFVPGAIMLSALLNLGFAATMAAGVTPFVIGGVVKAAIAAMMVQGGWKAWSRK